MPATEENPSTAGMQTAALSVIRREARNSREPINGRDVDNSLVVSEAPRSKSNT